MEKRGESNPGQGVLTLFQFVLLALFALASLLLAAASVRVCRLVEDNGAANSALRTSLAYVAGKLRAGDRADGVEVRTLAGLDVLVLTEEIQGEKYATYIYYYEGALREYYSRADYDFDAAGGTEIARAAGFRAERDGDLVTLYLTDSGGATRTQRLLLRAEGGGA